MSPISATLRIYFDDISSTVYKQICFDMWPQKMSYLVKVVFVCFVACAYVFVCVLFVCFLFFVVCVFVFLFFIVCFVFLSWCVFVCFVCCCFFVIFTAAVTCNLHNSVISTL